MNVLNEQYEELKNFIEDDIAEKEFGHGNIEGFDAEKLLNGEMIEVLSDDFGAKHARVKVVLSTKDVEVKDALDSYYTDFAGFEIHVYYINGRLKNEFYKDYENEATKNATYLVDLGDYDLYLNEENEVIQVLHENIAGWQTQEPSATYLTDKQLSELKRLVEKYNDAETTDDRDDAKFAIEDLI